MIIVVEPFDGRVFEGSVHSLDLAIGPGMPWLSKAMIDVILGTCEFETVCPEWFTIFDR